VATIAGRQRSIRIGGIAANRIQEHVMANDRNKKSGDQPRHTDFDQRPGAVGDQTDKKKEFHGNQPDRAHKRGEQDQRPGQKR
jgi:hypothetical protein